MGLLLTVLLGATDAGVDAGVELPRFDAPVYQQCREAPPLVAVDGGYFMPEPRAQRLTCLLNTCELDRAAKSRFIGETPPPPAWWLWALGVTSALSLGVALGLLWPR